MCSSNIPNKHYGVLGSIQCCHVAPDAWAYQHETQNLDPSVQCLFLYFVLPITTFWRLTTTVYGRLSQWTNVANFFFTPLPTAAFSWAAICDSRGHKLFLQAAKVDESWYWKYRGVLVRLMFLKRLNSSGNCRYHLLLRLKSLYSVLKVHLFAPHDSLPNNND